MPSEKARQKLLDYGVDDDVVMFDDEAYCDALVGVSLHPGTRAVYDYHKMIDELSEYNHWTYEEAADWIDCNTLRALPYLGDESPIVIDLFDE